MSHKSKQIGAYICIITICVMNNLFAQEELPNNTAFSFSSRPESTDSSVSASFLNTPITEETRLKVSKDGHLEANGKRVRIFGTNISTIPEKKDVANIVASLSAQGFNCIRFHHLDADWTNAFIKVGENGNRWFNYDQLEKFDYFFSELKKTGIYSNINLLTGRVISASEGFPKEFDEVNWKDKHVFGFWDDRGFNNQTDYAKKLISHVNPYTGLSYAQDPGTAIIEINNENGLVHAYLSNMLKDYSPLLLESLESKWNSWLDKKGLNYNKLGESFNKSAQLGDVLVNSESFWNLEHYEGAEAELTNNKNKLSLKVKRNGKQNWHVQINTVNLPLDANKLYTLKFRAKANKSATTNVDLMMAHDPWKMLGFSEKLSLNTKWQDFEFTVHGLTSDSNARLNFGDMGFSAGTTYEFADITLTEGGALFVIKKGEKNNSIAFPTYNEFRNSPDEYKQLILEFLYDTEKSYWSRFNDFLHNDLGIKCLVMGTSAGCSFTDIQAMFDIVDSHAYWNHPGFPVSDWDNSHYFVQNAALVDDLNGGTLASLADKRVYGKPFSVTEYDHPYPNQFSSEMLPMLATFAAYQDWDCIYSFAYEITPLSGLRQKISGFFDQAYNPAKKNAAPIAARIFRNFLVKEAEKSVYAVLDSKLEKSKLLTSRGWNVGPAISYGLDKRTSLTHKIGFVIPSASDGSLQLPENAIPVSEVVEITELEAKKRAEGGTTVSDTGELMWNPRASFFRVQTESAFVNVTFPHNYKAQINDSQTANIINFSNKNFPVESFVSSGDFGVLAAVPKYSKTDTQSIVIFASAWSGNSNEHLRPYGTKKISGKQPVKVYRDNIQLTTDSNLGSAPTLALSADGYLYTKPGYTLSLLDKNGIKTTTVHGDSGAPEAFRIKRNSGTLWYLLEKNK